MSDPIPPIEDTKPNQGIIGQVSKAVTEPLVGPLEKLIGEGRIKDTDRPRMFISLVLVLLAPFVVLASPDNTNVRIFILIVFALLIPIMWGGLIHQWLGRKRIDDPPAEKINLFIMVYLGSKARGIKDATVRVAGAKPFIGTTDESGQCIFEYPPQLRDQNQKVHVLAEKTGVGESDTIEIHLVGQTEPVYLELRPPPKGSISKDTPPNPTPRAGQIFIFISYSSNDYKYAETLQTQLTNEGLDVWVDKHKLQGGARFTIAIENAIRQSSHVIALISKASINSRWVRNEVAFALDNGKYVIPVMLEAHVEMPIEMYTTHFIDFYSDWASGYTELINLLSEIPADVPHNRRDMTTRFDPSPKVVRTKDDDTDPFFYGSVTPDDLFVGRKSELQAIVRRIGNRSLQSISIVGNRRIGKTSLLNFVTKQYRDLFPLHYKWAVIYLDMMDAGTHTIADVMSLLREGIAQQTGFELWNAADDGNIATMSTALKKLASDNKIRLVLCLDEFESILAHNDMNDFVETLRSLGNNSVIGMIVSTAHTLKDLCETSNLKSPFYNIFRTTFIGLMPEDEWTQILFNGLGKLDSDTIDFAREMAGGHPHLTQLVGSLLWQSKRENWTKDQIANLFYDEASEQVFTAIWQKLDDKARETIYIILGIVEQTPISDRVVKNLQQLGVLNKAGNNVFCKPFADFIRNETVISLPGNVPQHASQAASASHITPSTQTESILIVTVTKVEALAVREAFSRAIGKDWTRRTIGNKTYYDLGIHGGVPTFMVQSEMGTGTPGGALLTVNDAIDDLRPQAIIMCGIAFGLRPDSQQLGDILIAKQLQYYEPQKVDLQRGQIPRGDRVTSSERLLDRFRSGDNDWQGAKTHFGLVLSGEKLVNDPDFRASLLKNEMEAIGGEMEGAGLYTAARNTKVDWILVKAICDWADGNKNNDAQPLAARNAAEFVLHVLQLGGWGASNQPSETL